MAATSALALAASLSPARIASSAMPLAPGELPRGLQRCSDDFTGQINAPTSRAYVLRIAPSAEERYVKLFGLKANQQEATLATAVVPALTNAAVFEEGVPAGYDSLRVETRVKAATGNVFSVPVPLDHWGFAPGGEVITSPAPLTLTLAEPAPSPLLHVIGAMAPASGQATLQDVDGKVIAVHNLAVSSGLHALVSLPSVTPVASVTLRLKNVDPSGVVVTLRADGPVERTHNANGRPIGRPKSAVPTATVPDFPADEWDAKRFLSMATFGHTPDDVAFLMANGFSAWFLAQIDEPYVNIADAWRFSNAGTPEQSFDKFVSERAAFGDEAVGTRAQLRHRMTWEITNVIPLNVQQVSGGNGPKPTTADYVGMLQELAFSSWHEIVEGVTFHPAMGLFLSHIGNVGTGIVDGRSADQNYAREITQLFTIGPVELTRGGVEVVVDGRPVETYTQNFIVTFSEVFTGLHHRPTVDNTSYLGGQTVKTTDYDLPTGQRTTSEFPGYNPTKYRQMTVYNEYHNASAKNVLGLSIPAGMDAGDEIRLAVDYLVNEHPNCAPFVASRLVRRISTANPTPAYVERVADAFDAGVFVLPNGDRIGTGKKSDMTAVFAAILFDEEARRPDTARANPEYAGRLMDPVHWFVAVFRTLLEYREPYSLSPMRYRKRGTDSSAILALEGSVPDSGQGFLQPNNGVFGHYPWNYVPAGSAMAQAGLMNPAAKLWDEVGTQTNYSTLASLVIRNQSDGGWVFADEAAREAYYREHDVIQLIENDTERDEDGNDVPQNLKFVMPGMFAATSVEELYDVVARRIAHRQPTDETRAACLSILGAETYADLKYKEVGRLAALMACRIFVSPEFRIHR